MHTALKYFGLAIIGLSLLWSETTEAQATRDTYVVSTGVGSTLSDQGTWGRATYLQLWSGVVAGRPGQWRPYASVKVPINQLNPSDQYDIYGNRRGRYELKAVNLGGTYSVNSSLTAYVGGGWTHQRGRARVYELEPVQESFSRHSANVSVGLLIHTGDYVGFNLAVGANPGTASMSLNFRF